MTDKNNNDFVKIKDYIPDAIIDLKYTTSDNFIGEPFYDITDAYLRYGTMKKLMIVQEELKKQGFIIKIWDAYRPAKAQFKLWEILPDTNFVADPNGGYSCHTRGNAVDLTIVTLDNKEVEMPSQFDEFGAKAARDYSSLPELIQNNIGILEATMKKAGFVELFEEWWHYEDPDDYPPQDELIV